MTVSVGYSVNALNDLVGAYDGLVAAWNAPNMTNDWKPVIDALTALGGAIGAIAEKLPAGWSQAGQVTGVVGSGAAFLKNVTDYEDAARKGNLLDSIQAALSAGAAGAGFFAGILPQPGRGYAAGVSIALTLAKDTFPTGVVLPSPSGRGIIDTINIDPHTLLPRAISTTTGTTPDPLVKSIKWVPWVDPLILDLDGDGLEISPLSKGVLFDTNNDGVKNGTAWAAADDGMLVWDRNGNGSIDSGAELFGDETILANGKKAAHGFAALSELDSNADGKFDAADTQYANLRIWRDLNQDGISQAGELQTLAQTGVQSINLVSTTANTNYGDAQLVQNGSYTRVDGSGNTTTSQAGSFILAQNNFVRAFTPITVSTAAKTVANIGGSGWVRDLQEAMSLGTAGGLKLQEKMGDSANRACAMRYENRSKKTGYSSCTRGLQPVRGHAFAIATTKNAQIALPGGLRP